MPDQQQTPYLDAVMAYVARNPGRFHIPGHKGTGADPGLVETLGKAALLHDVPAGIEGIDVGPEPTPFQRSQRLAADAWGARRSWFLLNGASGGNHAICMTLAHATGKLRTGPPDRGPVVVQRNVHSSTIDGLVLSGLRPTFVAPEIDRELGIAHCVTPEALDASLEAEPEVIDRSVTLVESTSPNALLTASLDAARRFAATRGEELLSVTLPTLKRTGEQIREIP